MYVAAHRVRTATGDIGINAFLHLHGDQRLPLRGRGVPDIDAVTTLEGGYLVARSVTVRPGGNEVLAHLDLACPDDADEGELSAAVQTIRGRIGRDDEAVPFELGEPNVALRFAAVANLAADPHALRDILDDLWSVGRSLLTRRHETPAPIRGPYVVWAEPVANGVQLRLPAATLARLPRSARRLARVLVPRGLRLPGSLPEALREMSLMLLDLAEADADKEGGLEVVNPRTGDVLSGARRR